MTNRQPLDKSGEIYIIHIRVTILCFFTQRKREDNPMRKLLIPAVAALALGMTVATASFADGTGRFVAVTYELAIPEADNIDAKYSAYGNDGTWVEDVSKGTLTDESIDLGRGTAMIGEPRSQAAPANLTGVVIVQKPVYRTETRLFLVNGKLTERQVKTPTGEYEDTAVPAN